MDRKCESFFNGLHWILSNSNGDELSIICHDGSYGREKGLFEICPSWREPQKGDSVKGYMDFGEVQRWINELKKRENGVDKNGKI